VWQTEAWGFTLFDCQLPTPHLASLGARPWPRERFLAALEHALKTRTRRGRWVIEPGVIASRLG
jgi:leucyl/phenylalanyl-tRNA--protein transferase